MMISRFPDTCQHNYLRKCECTHLYLGASVVVTATSSSQAQREGDRASGRVLFVPSPVIFAAVPQDVHCRRGIANNERLVVMSQVAP